MAKYAFITFLVLIFSVQVHAKGSPFSSCKSLNDKIETYRYKRRKGGSGSQMHEWKTKLRGYESKFKKGKCRRFGNKLN